MNAARILLAACTALLAVSGLRSQEEDDRQTQMRKKIEAMREALREGRVAHYNVRVMVRLKNGNRLKGVVKNGRFVELHDGLDFVPTDRENPSAGLRVWYTAGTNSFLFIPHTTIAHYKIGVRLSDEQVKALEEKLVSQRQEADEQARKAAEAQQKAQQQQLQQPGTGGSDGTSPSPVGTTKAIPKLSAAQLKLLEEFPPEAGWGKEKIDKLARDRVVIGRFPDEKEKKFESVFAAWVAAYDARLAKEQAEKEAKEEAARRAASPHPGPGPGGGVQYAPPPNIPPPVVPAPK